MSKVTKAQAALLKFKKGEKVEFDSNVLRTMGYARQGTIVRTNKLSVVVSIYHDMYERELETTICKSYLHAKYYK